MKVELDHNGLVTLVRGCIPSYDQMEHWSVKGRGHFTDNNGWFWNTEILSKLSDEELIRLYTILSRQESKQPEESKGESTIRHIPYESLSADQKDEYDEMIYLEKLSTYSDISIHQECRFMFLWGKYMYDDKINNLNELRAYCKASEQDIVAWGMADRASYLAKKYPDQYAEFIRDRENSKDKVIRQPKVFKLSDINYGTEFIEGDSIECYSANDIYGVSTISKSLLCKAREIGCHVVEVKNADGSCKLVFYSNKLIRSPGCVIPGFFKP